MNVFRTVFVYTLPLLVTLLAIVAAACGQGGMVPPTPVPQDQLTEASDSPTPAKVLDDETPSPESVPDDPEIDTEAIQEPEREHVLAELCRPTGDLSSIQLAEPGPYESSKFEVDAQGRAILHSEGFDTGPGDWQLEPDWQHVAEGASGGAIRGNGHSWATYRADAWGDFTLGARLKLVEGSVHLNYRTAGCTRYYVGIEEGGVSLTKQTSCEVFGETVFVEATINPGEWHHIEIAGAGGRIDVSVDGVLALSHIDPQPLLFGGIAFESLPGSEVVVDEVTVTGDPPPDLGLIWVRTGGPSGGLGYDVRMMPDDPDVMLVTDAWAGVHLSIDGGRTWTSSNEGISTRTGPTGDAIPIFSLTVDPIDHDILWAGTQGRRGIFRSEDGGLTWARRDDGVVEDEGITFRGFAVDPFDSDVVYAAAEISSFVWAGRNRHGREFDMTAGVVYKTTDAGQSWEPIWRGDNLTRYVWIDPRDTKVIYVSTGIFDREAANSDPKANVPGGVGVVKSDDGGATWQTFGSDDGLANSYVGSLFMHPDDPDTLLAGVGNVAYSDGSGVYLTTDGGKSWRLVLDTFGSAVTSVEFTLANPRVAYAGTESEVFRSEDGAVTWDLVSGGSRSPTGKWGAPGMRAGFPIDFEVHPADADTIFANNYGGGNFLSRDGGQTWIDASAGYTGATLRDVAVDPNNPLRVFAIGRSGPFCSSDGGTTWQGLAFGEASFSEWFTIAVDPANSDRIFASNEFHGDLLVSTDGGRNWTHATGMPVFEGHVGDRYGVRVVAFAPSDPKVVYAGIRRDSHGDDLARNEPGFGVMRSDDGGLTWGTANDAQIAGKNINDLAVHPDNSDVVYAATNRSGIFVTRDGGATWLGASEGLGTLKVTSLQISSGDADHIYAGLQNGGIYRSEDGGLSWRPSSTGVAPSATVRDIAVDPTNPDLLYASDHHSGVYRSDDGGRLWTPINDGLRTRAVVALALSSDGGTLYAATEGEGIFRLDISLPDRGF